MSKTMKVIFEMGSTQVDANFFNNEVLSAIKKEIESGEYDDDDIIEYIREHRDGDGVALSNGMFVHDNNMKCTIEDGDEKLNVSLMLYSSDDDQNYEELVEENDLQEAEAILSIDLNNVVWPENNEDQPKEDQHVMLEVVSYMSGQLVGYFEVDDNLKLKNINMQDFLVKIHNVDAGGDIGSITYSRGIVGTQYEDEISQLYYKGKNIELGLNFQGGGGEVLLFIRDEDGDLAETEIADIVD